MKLLSLKASRYRCLRDETIELRDLNVFIGKNASGKSTILDALRFLHEAVQERDFRMPVSSRGGIAHLAWKGEAAKQIELVTHFHIDGEDFEWSVLLLPSEYNFSVIERVCQIYANGKTEVLSSHNGKGWWLSEETGTGTGAGPEAVTLKQSETACALAAASADASFPARAIAEFVSRWGFFDPNPFLLRRDWTGLDSGTFDPYGRNLGERLYHLRKSSPKIFDRIVSATQSVLGLPVSIEVHQTEDRFSFVQTEKGLRQPVHQMGVSSGTLRMLAFMTALIGETDANLIGLEEPENYLHPTALESFAEYLQQARDRIQILVTTHSPLLLNYLNEPAAVCVVHHIEGKGTCVTREKNAAGVHEALKASGFGLGEFYETKGFGG